MTTQTRLFESRAIEVPMEDGVALAVTRFPAPASPTPAIVILTPYRKEMFAMDMGRSGVAQLGYELIVADVRGTGGSGGEWDGPLSSREISDGVELLEWVAEQDFCDGQTALFGPSYLGMNTLLIAARRPRGLRCIVSIVPPVDVYRDMWYRGGIPSLTNWGAIVAYRNPHRPSAQQRILHDFYVTTVADPFDGERLQHCSAEYILDKIEAPVLLLGGWYDFCLRGTIRAFEGVQAPKRLVIGSWGHGDPDAAQFEHEPSRWFSYWLRGAGNDPAAEANVVLQCVGTDAWASYENWPAVAEIDWEQWQPVAIPAVVPTATVVGESVPDSHSPIAPGEDLEIDTGMHLWGETWTADTAPVVEPTRYRGPVTLNALLVSEEATDLDLHARISIVRADGSVHQVTEGRLRASHRALDPCRTQMTADGQVAVPWHPHDRAEPLPVGEPVTLHVEIFPVNLELAPGEALRLGITFVRSDQAVGPSQVVLQPETRLLLPRADA